MLRRGPAVGLLCVFGLGLGLACASPTLPLPPPETPDVTRGVDAAHVHLSAGCGGAQPYAQILVENMNTTLPSDQRIGGSITDGCGAWDANVFAHFGDSLQVSQIVDGVTSLPTYVQDTLR